MARMRRYPLTVIVLLAASYCASCAEEDAVLALNVKLEDSAKTASSLAVTLTQGGQTKLTTTVNVPTEPTDAGMISKTSFYERITLAGLSDGPAMVSVEAKQGATSLGTASGNIEVELDGAYASYVTLGMPKPADDTAK
jgi:hypothetical protein